MAKSKKEWQRTKKFEIPTMHSIELFICFPVIQKLLGNQIVAEIFYLEPLLDVIGTLKENDSYKPFRYSELELWRLSLLHQLDSIQLILGTDLPANGTEEQVLTGNSDSCAFTSLLMRFRAQSFRNANRLELVLIDGKKGMASHFR